jgi:hypothetical protein
LKRATRDASALARSVSSAKTTWGRREGYPVRRGSSRSTRCSGDAPRADPHVVNFGRPTGRPGLSSARVSMRCRRALPILPQDGGGRGRSPLSLARGTVSALTMGITSTPSACTPGPPAISTRARCRDVRRPVGRNGPAVRGGGFACGTLRRPRRHPAWAGGANVRRLLAAIIARMRQEMGAGHRRSGITPGTPRRGPRPRRGNRNASTRLREQVRLGSHNGVGGRAIVR